MIQFSCFNCILFALALHQLHKFTRVLMSSVFCIYTVTTANINFCKSKMVWYPNFFVIRAKAECPSVTSRANINYGLKIFVSYIVLFGIKEYEHRYLTAKLNAYTAELSYFLKFYKKTHQVLYSYLLQYLSPIILVRLINSKW